MKGTDFYKTATVFIVATALLENKFSFRPTQIVDEPDRSRPRENLTTRITEVTHKGQDSCWDIAPVVITNNLPENLAFSNTSLPTTRINLWSSNSLFLGWLNKSAFESLNSRPTE